MKKFLLLLTLFSLTASAADSPCYFAVTYVKCFPSSGIYLTTPQALYFSGAGFIQATSIAAENGFVGNTRGTNAVDLQLNRTVNSYVASGTGAALLGGKENTSALSYSTVAGGTSNIIASDAEHPTLPGGAFIGSGDTNSIHAGMSVIDGGKLNTITTSAQIFNPTGAGPGYSTIAGGLGNTVANSYSFIGSGNSNSVAADGANILRIGGAFIGSGDGNSIHAGLSAIGSGQNNTVTTAAQTSSTGPGFAAIAGGHGNTVSSPYSAIFAFL